jgi:hypothetical protein
MRRCLARVTPAATCVRKRSVAILAIDVLDLVARDAVDETKVPVMFFADSPNRRKPGMSYCGWLY